MSSNKFLQRFQGKIQVVGKEGVTNVFGGKNQNVVVYTNNNFNPQNKNQTGSSLNKPKTNDIPKQTRTSLKKGGQNNEPPSKKEVQKLLPPPPPPKEKKTENPFLISNPFYLDQEDKARMEQERKQRELLQKLQKQKERQAQKANQDSKKTTTANLNRSLDKKKNEKEWTKLGGLGPNIGGEQWMEKKKKTDKIQQFSQQVKSINKERLKVPKPVEKKQQKKELNPRQKALQYSKNVPKPVVKVYDQKEQQAQKQVVPQVQKQLSELQLYQKRHQQLKNMLRNQI